MASSHRDNVFSVLDTPVCQAFTNDVRTTSEGEDENEDPTLASRGSQCSYSMIHFFLVSANSMS